jgi:hypothetical protein
MFLKIKNSFAFRSGAIYRFFLVHLKPRFVTQKLISNEIELISLCGKAHVDMLVESIYTFIKTQNAIPRIIIYTDGSISEEIVAKKLKWAQKYVEIKAWDFNINDYKSAEFDAIKKLGFQIPIGKKLWVIVTHSLKKPTLWIDTDILFFKNFDLTDCIQKNSFFVKSTEDYQPAYDNNIAALNGTLSQKPYINTGIFFCNGDILQHNDLNQELELVSKVNNHFSEQSILAKVIHAHQKNVWDLNTIACFQSDTQTLKPTFMNKPWVARHYVGPVRHLFWRDAFFSRFV